MPIRRRLYVFLVGFAAVVAASSGGRAGRAEEDDDPEPGQAEVQNQFMLADENFEQWVFGNERNATEAMRRLVLKLDVRIEELDRAARLTSGQVNKLRLAGRGDTKRFFDRVEAARKSFQLVKNDQNKFQAFWPEIQPLQQSIQTGLFGDGSLFDKTVRKVLDKGQADAFEKVLLDRQRDRYRAKILVAVATLDNSVGLKAEQRERLVDLLTKETRPPKKFGPYDYLVVMLQASKIPQDRLKPLFNDAQWRTVTQQLKQAKGMEAFLTTNGYLPDEPAKPEGGKNAGKPEPRP